MWPVLLGWDGNRVPGCTESRGIVQLSILNILEITEFRKPKFSMRAIQHKLSFLFFFTCIHSSDTHEYLLISNMKLNISENDSTALKLYNKNQNVACSYNNFWTKICSYRGDFVTGTQKRLQQLTINYSIANL